MPIERLTKQIVITMTVIRSNELTLETELEVNDLGASEVPEELFKKDKFTSGVMEKEIFDLLKSYFENKTGIPIIVEEHRK